MFYVLVWSYLLPPSKTKKQKKKKQQQQQKISRNIFHILYFKILHPIFLWIFR